MRHTRSHPDYGWVSDLFALKMQSRGLTGGLAGGWGLAGLCAGLAELWASLATWRIHLILKGP